MIWISAAALVIPPLIGLGGTVIGMIGAMDTMGLEGGIDPEALAENISLAMITTAGGLVVSLLALPVFIIAIVLFIKSRRELKTLTQPDSVSESQSEHQEFPNS